MTAAALAPPCACGCDAAGHRLFGGRRGGCTVHANCREFTLVLTGEDEGRGRCGCGAALSQHYADQGRLRGPRGCQDFHTVCTPLCKHTAPLLRGRHTEGEITAPRRRQTRTAYPEPTAVPAHLADVPVPPPAEVPAALEAPQEPPVVAEPPPAAPRRRPSATRRPAAAATADMAAATRFIAAALNAYPAWYCGRCAQRRLDRGRCPSCTDQLVPVHVVIVPRELP